MSVMKPVRIVGVGGSLRKPSWSFEALQHACGAANRLGAEVSIYSVADVGLPLFDPVDAERVISTSTHGRAFMEDIARADGLIFATPAYHGGISGALKNLIDYVELLKPRGYLSGKAVAAIAVGTGRIAAVNACGSITQYAQALRAVPVPMPCPVIDADSAFSDGASTAKLEMHARLEATAHQCFALAAALRTV